MAKKIAKSISRNHSGTQEYDNIALLSVYTFTIIQLPVHIY